MAAGAGGIPVHGLWTLHRLPEMSLRLPSAGYQDGLGVEMPIYEYVCNSCGERFERLVLRLAAQAGHDGLTCPYCGSEDVERAVSPFTSMGGSCTTTKSGYT